MSRAAGVGIASVGIDYKPEAGDDRALEQMQRLTHELRRDTQVIVMKR